MQMIGLSPDQVELVTHAVRLFAESGLTLPPLVVEGHDDTAGCDGHDGLHRPHSGWSEIDLCVADPDSRAVMHTVLHEIAHAWAAGALTDARRTAFQELRDVEVWRDYEKAAWADNGTEQAAEIIAWGVNDQPAATVRIDQVSCDELHDGYVVLTGSAGWAVQPTKCRSLSRRARCQVAIAHPRASARSPRSSSRRRFSAAARVESAFRLRRRRHIGLGGGRCDRPGDRPLI
jgi:hypothetical protein